MSNVKGLKTLIGKLERIPKQLDKTVDAIVEANAQEIEAEAKRLVPRDTGALGNSIGTIKVENKTYKVATNTTGLAPYGPFVEFGEPRGTGPNGGPRPFLFPAFRQGQKRLIQDLDDLLENTVSKI